MLFHWQFIDFLKENIDLKTILDTHASTVKLSLKKKYLKGIMFKRDTAVYISETGLSYVDGLPRSFSSNSHGSATRFPSLLDRIKQSEDVDGQRE